MREISLNTMYTFLTAGKRSFDQIQTLARQIFHEDFRTMCEVYKRICEEQPFSYMFLDLHPCSDWRAKIKTNIFKEEQPTVLYVPKKKNKRK